MSGVSRLQEQRIFHEVLCSCVRIVLKIEMLEYCCSKLFLLSFYCNDERDYPFSTYAIFSEEVIFLPPHTHMYLS